MEVDELVEIIEDAEVDSKENQQSNINENSHKINNINNTSEISSIDNQINLTNSVQFENISETNNSVNSKESNEIQNEDYQGNNLETNFTKNNEENDIVALSSVIDIDNFRSETNENLTLIEIGRSSWKSNNVEQKYLRGCIWSPDGTCVLTAINGEGMQIFEIPSDIYETNSISKSERKLSNLKPAVVIPESGTVYDYNWFPHMNSNDPATCCWIASRQHEPIHMWDAFTGELRCTYRGYDQFDEVECALSAVFSPDGENVIAGYKKSLKLFQTNIPGRDYTEIKCKKTISTIAMHYNHPDMIITGSWNSTINIFDRRATNLGCLTTIHGHSGGVTLLKIDSNGEKLYSGARKDNLILEWDLRNFKLPIDQYKRDVFTNQKIYFDLSPCNKYLFTGGTNGIVKGWNINDNDKTELQFNLHSDCCNGVGFSAIRPVMCTTSGQYKFVENFVEKCEQPPNNNKDNEIEIKYENSLVLWWYGNNEE